MAEPATTDRPDGGRPRSVPWCIALALETSAHCAPHHVHGGRLRPAVPDQDSEDWSEDR
jgi:hypothetical protein